MVYTPQLKGRETVRMDEKAAAITRCQQKVLSVKLQMDMVRWPSGSQQGAGEAADVKANIKAKKSTK